MDLSQKLHTLEDNVPFDSTATESDVYNCFRLVLGRYPSRAEWNMHLSHVGRPLASVTAVYVDSAEYRNLRNSADKPRVAQLPGFAMYVLSDDVDISKHILEDQEYEAHVAQEFTKRLREGMTVLDVGANIGYFTFLAAVRVGPSGHVLAIEPNRRNAACLLATRARNEFRNVEIIQAAASDRWEVLQLWVAPATSNGTALHPEGVEPSDFVDSVMAFPLSACLGDVARVDVVKIDVEGAEGKAIQGMIDILDRDLPVVFSEFTPCTLPKVSGISPAEYLDIFTARGYRLAVLETSGPRFMDAPSVLEHADAFARDSHLDILAEPVRAAGA